MESSQACLGLHFGWHRGSKPCMFRSLPAPLFVARCLQARKEQVSELLPMGQFAGRTWLAWKEARNKDKMCQMTAFQRLISIQKCELQSSGNPRNRRTPCLLMARAAGWLAVSGCWTSSESELIFSAVVPVSSESEPADLPSSQRHMHFEFQLGTKTTGNFRN